MLDGEHVRLEFRPRADGSLRRTLAYVWLGNELFNEVLVARRVRDGDHLSPERALRGTASSLHSETREATSEGSGEMSATSPSRSTLAEEGTARQVTVSASLRNPPDLDCAEVSATNFAVTGNDPHGFDVTTGGVGCET
jgi:hypothetical protein